MKGGGREAQGWGAGQKTCKSFFVLLWRSWRFQMEEEEEVEVEKELPELAKEREENGDGSEEEE